MGAAEQRGAARTKKTRERRELPDKAQSRPAAQTKKNPQTA